MNKLIEFKRKVDTGLSQGLGVPKKAENADRLLGDLLKGLLAGDDKGLADAGYEYLKSKATGITSKSVKELLAKFDLQEDGEVALAIASLGQSDSVNGLALDVMRRVQNGGSNDKDIFKHALKRLTDKAFQSVELRGTLAEMGINLPTDPNEDHWTKRLLEKFTTVGKFRNEEWSAIEGTMTKATGTPGAKEEDVWGSDKRMMKKLWAGELGPQKDMEHFPKLRKDLLKGNVDLAAASYFEKQDKTSMDAITSADIENMEIEGKSRNEMGSLRNQVKTVKAESDKKTETGEEASSSENVKNTMTDKEAFTIGQSIQGGSDKVAGLDDLAKIAPLIANVSGVAGPQVALAIAAAKIYAAEMEKRQKEADELLLQNEEMAKQARDESLALMEKLSLDFAETGQAELIGKIATLKSMVTAADTFKAVGKNFKGPKELYDTLNSNAMVLPASKGSGVIESYKTNEDLVASVSGGQALHGLVLVMEDYPVVAGSVPALKRPEHV